MPEVADELRTFIESGLQSVTIDDVRARTAGTRQAPRRPRTAVLVGGLVGVVTVAAVLVLALLVLPSGTPGGPTSAAAAALNRLSVQAASATRALEPGQYAYTDVEIQPVVLNGSSTGHAYLDGTEQTWINAAGTGRMVITTDPTLHFYTPADRAAWVAAGSPSLVDPSQTAPQIYTVSPTLTPSTVQAPLYRVAEFSTDPTTLAQDLASGAALVEDFSNPGCSTRDCLVFAKAADLLQGPSIGMTPALSGALFKVLADVPGTTALGTVTNRAGRSGVGFRYVEKIPAQRLITICDATSGVSATTKSSTVSTTPPYTIAFDVVVDSNTTSVVGTMQSTTPSVLPTTSSPCSSRSALTQGFYAPSWTSLLAEGVSSSATATP